MVIVTSLDRERTEWLDSFPDHTGTSFLKYKNETICTCMHYNRVYKITWHYWPFNDIHNPNTILRLLKQTVECAQHERMENGLIKYLYISGRS